MVAPGTFGLFGRESMEERASNDFAVVVVVFEVDVEDSGDDMEGRMEVMVRERCIGWPRLGVDWPDVFAEVWAEAKFSSDEGLAR